MDEAHWNKVSKNGQDLVKKMLLFNPRNEFMLYC